MHRSVFIDLVKALASQVIVLHHMVLYTPMSAVLALWAPAWVDWLARDGRLAVPCFLVVSGYLAHQSLASGRPVVLAQLLFQRFLRLAILLWLALFLVVASSLLWRHVLQGQPWFSPLPSLGTLLAHLFFLQDIFAIPSISAGAWYVAIDMQLYALSAVGVWAAQKLPRAGGGLLSALVAVGVLLSAGLWHPQDRLDMWAPYFYFAYGLGWLASSAQAQRRQRWLLGAVALATGLLGQAGTSAWPVVACTFALLLYGASLWRLPARLGGPLVQQLSRHSYALFVSHYAVIIVFSGVWFAWGLAGLAPAAALFVLTWFSANLLARGLDPVGQRLLRRLRRSE